MDASGLKRKDTVKGPPLRVLSLDGGGVRGYSMLLIVQALMHHTYSKIEGEPPHLNKIPKPCDHFDLIVGTGTGGLIALMLGRMRLDLETCKELYVQMTQMVFETDKTIAGIPYRSTLFKATKLEEAIKQAVREHTIARAEGNDDSDAEDVEPDTPGSVRPPSAAVRSSAASTTSPRRHVSNASVVSFSARGYRTPMARPMFPFRGGGGNPDALLYDKRKNRTKTAVTAIYKGTRKGDEPAMLRSYDALSGPAAEPECRIWEAGRATCAIGLAFKPIQIGQSVFHDDGAGTFNPSMTALDEALREWPGREIGVFVSVGTGKRPKGSDANSSMWYEGFLGEFAEARRKLIMKIENCEHIHDSMKRGYLAERNVSIDNYYRLNVEVGVGEFGMNEWHRLADISTNTRRYLAREEERHMVESAAAKLATIHRLNRANPARRVPDLIQTTSNTELPVAFELPGDMPSFPLRKPTPPSRQSYESGRDSLLSPGAGVSTPSPRSSGERLHPSPKGGSPRHPQRTGAAPPAAPPSYQRPDDSDRLVVNAPTPTQYRNASGADKIAIIGPDDQPGRRSQDLVSPIRHTNPHNPRRIEPPPLPPKTPLLENQMVSGGGWRPAGSAALPYPVDDDVPPAVNMARKPNYGSR
ncbi:calcium-independent phospholipase A2-gamma [Diplogelasinospora grovesii]|uniref:Calcium-independent phospholipase A2-gamma n=1 Tax=Diplogelasinospora grovesii TaxID=303347 RepID=A0AAN6S5K5_9PEZI|nr:calcium-independent phospholipase A2-gamma [Diplogelasinospora grovesii]